MTKHNKILLVIIDIIQSCDTLRNKNNGADCWFCLILAYHVWLLSVSWFLIRLISPLSQNGDFFIFIWHGVLWLGNCFTLINVCFFVNLQKIWFLQNQLSCDRNVAEKLLNKIVDLGNVLYSLFLLNAKMSALKIYY